MTMSDLLPNWANEKPDAIRSRMALFGAYLEHVPSDLDLSLRHLILQELFVESRGTDLGLSLAKQWLSRDGSMDEDWLDQAWGSFRPNWERSPRRIAEIAKEHGTDIVQIDEVYGPAWGNGEGTSRHATKPWYSDEEVIQVTARLEKAIIPDDPTGSKGAPVPIVENYLYRSNISLIYGTAHIGKSLFVLDLANHIARGAAWNGLKTVKGLVVYIAAEGAGGLSARLAALEHGKSPDLVAVTDVVDLCDQKSVLGLTSFVQSLEPEHGRVSLIIIDTLAQSMPGSDENSGRDMRIMLSNLRTLWVATGANVMLVHHSGKEHERGPRGHSSLVGAADSILFLRESSGVTTVTVQKQKDGIKHPDLAFRVEQTEHPLHSARVRFVPVPARARKGSSSRKYRSQVLDLLKEWLADPHRSVSLSLDDGEDAVQAVSLSEFRIAAAKGIKLTDTSRRRRAVDNTIAALVNEGAVHRKDDHLWL